MDDWYSVLQVAPGADQDVIVTAHQWLSQRYDPANDPSDFAAERLRQVHEAFAVLGDPERRAEYDAGRDVSAAPAEAAPAPAVPPPAQPAAAATFAETPRPSSAPEYAVPASPSPSHEPIPPRGNGRAASVMLGVIVAVTFVVAFAVAIAAWFTAEDDDADYSANRGDGDYDLENMTFREADMPEGVIFLGSAEIDDVQEWAGAYFPDEEPGEIDEQEFNAKVAQLEAQGWLRSSVAEGRRPAFFLLGVKSFSTLYTNVERATESADKFACGLPIELSEQLEEFTVPKIADQSVGFRHRREFMDESGNVLFSFVDTTVCFRTGRIVHVVQDTWIDGTEDVGASIRAAYNLLDRVNDAYNGTVEPLPEEDEEEEGG